MIQPQPGSLRQASGTVPTIRGPIGVSVANEPNRPFVLRLNIPVNVTARVGLPHTDRGSTTVTLDGQERKGHVERGYVFVDGVGSGPHVLTCE
ncbi:MAG: hypothetical protein JW888_14450 [Pirellulales bacterium]|nr:hypothetical protein [Pirellulales bacterium]